MGYWFDGSVTDLEITNMALSKIGHNKITSMSEMDDISLTHIFNQTRDMLQARYSWAFCRHRKVLYPSPVELLNSLKSNLNAHAADTTMHSNADTVNFPITDADITSMEDIVALANKLRVAYKAHYDDAALMAGWAYHVSTESIDHSLSIVTSPATQEEAILIINQLLEKFNGHDSDQSSHNVATLHQEARAECGDPEFEYNYQYYLPSDYLGIPEEYYSSSSRYFVIEGDRILSNNAFLNFKYNRRAPANITYSRLFSECMILGLAEAVVMHISQDKSLSLQLKELLRIKLLDSYQADAGEGNPEIKREDTLWQSR